MFSDCLRSFYNNNLWGKETYIHIYKQTRIHPKPTRNKAFWTKLNIALTNFMQIIELWLSLTNKSSLKLFGEELLDCDADSFESFGNNGLIQTLQIQCSWYMLNSSKLKNHKATMSLFSSKLIENTNCVYFTESEDQTNWNVLVVLFMHYYSAWAQNKRLCTALWRPLKTNLVILFTPFNFATLHNMSPLLTMVCLLGKDFF